MSGPTAASTTFYRPAEVAQMLRCSEWWVKEQARQRRIPYCWIGGSYRFTPEHIAEIARLCEVRPTDNPDPASSVAPNRRRSAGAETDPAVLVLQARPPRRLRNASPVQPAA